MMGMNQSRGKHWWKMEPGNSWIWATYSRYVKLGSLRRCWSRIWGTRNLLGISSCETKGEGSRIVQRKKSNCESDLTKLPPALWKLWSEYSFFWVFCLAGLLYANLAYCMQAVPGRAWPQTQWLHSHSRPWRSWQMEAPDCRLCNWALEGGSGWHISMFPTGDERWQNLVHKWRNCP